ncbi:unnamed protein product [Gordionus sp. m RMFG-2023]|uniref:uncharacterized protein LOC135924078 n=1 Tax=Gordionus sp. m RMFG-2023 TaxID=3053472 RepID=UPI0030E58D61
MLISLWPDNKLHKWVIGISILFICFLGSKIFLNNESFTFSRLFSFIKQNSLPQIIINIPTNFDYDVNTPNCKIRRLNPKDKSILHFIGRTVGPLTCSKVPALTTLQNSILKINYNVLKKYYKKINLDFCKYHVILRDYKAKNPDDYTKLSLDEIVFKNHTFVREDFVMVKCYDKKKGAKGGVIFYNNTHANGVIDAITYLKYRRKSNRTRPNPKNYKIFLTSPIKINKIKVGNSPKVKNNKNKKILSVLMVGIDSTSRLNFLRGLPNTHRYLSSQRKDNFMFNGYIKVGDNTFPNLVPLLSGKFIEEYPKSFGKIYFDNISFVWKAYRKSKIDYATAFIEDTPNLATFNYVRKGFYDPPTDFYYRPYSIESNKLFRKEEDCIQDKHEVQALLEYSKDLMVSLKSWPYFCLTYTTQLTHNYLNNIKYLDKLFLNYFKSLFASKSLENTVVIIFGDHGMRYGDFRKTFIGMMEERLPLLFVLPPAWFLSKYPSIHYNMKINTKRILSPFDVHKTLLHLIKLNEHGAYTDSKFDHKVRGFSFLEEIPFNRSCESAEIPLHYCPCNLIGGGLIESNQREELKVSALAIVATINTLLKPVQNVCKVLALSNLDTARIFSLENQEYGSENSINFLKNRRFSKIRLLLTIEVEPSEALFEASLGFNSISQLFDKVIGDISRVNKYYNQSWCISDPVMKKYCFCKIQPLKSKRSRKG